MANELDEITGSVNQEGRDVHVIEKQLPVTIGVGSLLFEMSLWVVGFIPAILLYVGHVLPQDQALWVGLLGFLPGPVFLWMKAQAKATLNKLQQRIQADASQIDHFLEQRVIVLENVVGLLDKSIELDKSVMEKVTAYRSGITPAQDGERNAVAQNLNQAFSLVRATAEAYPDLKSQSVIADAMRQNTYLQQEITAARGLYNDAVLLWNEAIFDWPTKQIIAARAHYTSRIPFTVSAETREAARSKFF
ncbi:LemA family protein [Acetobacteraceae bacterium]|nr:LemA family protein [Acetobacteraceae bacterium]